MIRNLDNNWDWCFGHSLQDYTQEEKEIELDILTSIKSWRNNCFFDLEYGIDWYNILGSRNKSDQLKNELIRLLININGVARINKINYNITPERKINININLEQFIKIIYLLMRVWANYVLLKR